MSSNLTPFFTVAKYSLYIIFIAAFFFVVARALNLDIIEMLKNMIKKSPKNVSIDGPEQEAYDKGYTAGMAAGLTRPCEGFQCVEDTKEAGALIEKGGIKKIVCADCVQLYSKTGWTLEMKWGDEND